MSTRRLLVAVATALAVTAAAHRPAEAQVRFAPQVSWGDDADLALGARLLINASRLFSTYADEGIASKIDIVVPFEWYLDCTDCTYFELTPGLILPLTIKDTGPYLGAGLNIARISVDAAGRDESDIDLGLGLTAGLQIPVASFMGFGEVRFTAGGSKQTVVTVGLQLGASRN